MTRKRKASDPISRLRDKEKPTRIEIPKDYQPSKIMIESFAETAINNQARYGTCRNPIGQREG